ncbi:MAG: hypothetical protein QGM46_04985 [Actinomycetota bacterium]|nr:hypothetical protein [Actinomycetota bacterium]MDK1016272.1 hypothetical protein [Actinomycetota bacterium]MDK1026028.1 hypothetical protein [Actinomycetota bacterium]MDK1037860.1 hypothetical protein [Actinomycetota bacterium]MDK1096877.1 hypothetical protein [Actinomycetota bacterium]
MRRTTALFIAVALVLTACQSATEKLTERALEQATGASDIDFDVDTGEIKIETDDESTWFEGAVTISVTDCFDFNLDTDTDNFNAVCVNIING